MSPANALLLFFSSQPYEEIVDLEQLQNRMVQSLSEYNARSRKPMDLVMFMFAVEHISRLARYRSLRLFSRCNANDGIHGCDEVLASHQNGLKEQPALESNIWSHFCFSNAPVISKWCTPKGRTYDILQCSSSI